MIFQDPLSSLNPVVPIGVQVTEVLERHRGHEGRGAPARRPRSCWTGSASPTRRRRLKEYPHQLSGGMRQRALIAMAVACAPRLLIADEPTTALDVTIQAQILELLKELVRDSGTALLMITHDLGVVAGLCDTINVLYAGRVVETAPPAALFAPAPAPVHASGCSARSRAWTPPRGERLTPDPRLGARRAAVGRRAARSRRAASTASTPASDAPPDLQCDAPAQHAYRCVNPVLDREVAA